MLSILIAISLVIIIQKVRIIIAQLRHLSEEDIEDFSKGFIERDGDEYGRIIGHLASCEDCQERLHNFQSGKNIEKHFID